MITYFNSNNHNCHETKQTKWVKMYNSPPTDVRVFKTPWRKPMLPERSVRVIDRSGNCKCYIFWLLIKTLHVAEKPNKRTPLGRKRGVHNSRLLLLKRMVLKVLRAYKWLLKGVYPAINEQWECKKMFVSVWLCCCSDNIVIYSPVYSHRYKFKWSFQVYNHITGCVFEKQTNWTNIETDINYM